MKIHIVKKGDTLYELSKKYGVPFEKIVDANPQLVDPNKLDIGIKIKIPTEPVPVPGGTAPIIHKHTVKQGDSLWKLSKAWGVSLKELIDANPQLKNPNALLVGEVVNIPATGTYSGGTEVPQPGAGPSGNKTVPGSKTNTGTKEEMTAPIQEQVPEIPLPLVPAVPEAAVAPEIVVKPEITIMPELIVMPEMPSMPEVIEKTIIVEKECEPVTNIIPQPVCPEEPAPPSFYPCPPMPEYPMHSMPEYPMHTMPEYPVHTMPAVDAFVEGPCGCMDGAPLHTAPQGWQTPEHFAVQQPQYAYPMHQDIHQAPTSHYPGISEQPSMMDVSPMSVSEPYTSGKESYAGFPPQAVEQMYGSHQAIPSGHGSHHISPCGCHGEAMMPMHHVDYGMWDPCMSYPSAHHFHYGAAQYPVMPAYGGMHPMYMWPQYDVEPVQTMGMQADPYAGMSHSPWHEQSHVPPHKDCGCHGRQLEDHSWQSAGDAAHGFQTDETTDLSEERQNDLDGLIAGEGKAQAKVSRQEQTRARSKTSQKKERRTVNKPKRKNPWIKN